MSCARARRLTPRAAVRPNRGRRGLHSWAREMTTKTLWSGGPDSWDRSLARVLLAKAPAAKAAPEKAPLAKAPLAKASFAKASFAKASFAKASLAKASGNCERGAPLAGPDGGSHDKDPMKRATGRVGLAIGEGAAARALRAKATGGRRRW